MAEFVTLKLPETLAQRAKEIAALTNRRIEDVLVEWIERANTEIPVESLPDNWVLRLCDMQIEPEQQAALSNLKGDKTTAVDPETSETVNLFNPRTQVWSEHFQWAEDGLRIVGRTPTGRATVAALHMSDDPDAIEVRSYWVMAGWHPPED